MYFEFTTVDRNVTGDVCEESTGGSGMGRHLYSHRAAL